MNSSLNNLQVVDEIEIAQSKVDKIQNFRNILQYVKSTDFTIIAQNIRSIYKNFDGLCVALSNFSFAADLLVLSECRLDANKPIPGLNNYTSFSTTNHLNQCDGVVVYLKTLYKSSIKEIKLMDASCVQLTVSNYTIICIYRSPSNTNANNFINSLSAHLDSIKTHENIIITGDININIKITEQRTEGSQERTNRLSYLNMLAMHGLLPGHVLSTREHACLDHFMLKMDSSMYLASIVVFDSTITDHSMILLKLSSTIKPKIHKTKYQTIINYEKAILSLKESNLDDLTTYNNPTELTNTLITKLQKCLYDNTITKRICSKDRLIKPWITPGILKCIRNRNDMQRKLRADPFNEILKITYRRYRNFCVNLIRKLKIQYERELLAKNKQNSKSLWQTINHVTSRNSNKTSNLDLLDSQNTPLLAVDHVNMYFVSIGKALAQKISPGSSSQKVCNLNQFHSSPVASFAFLKTDCEEVYRTIMSLKSESAPGWDNVSTRFLKLASKTIVPVISHLANLCFELGIFPAALKKAIITPVYKNGDKSDVSNYRPISVLTAISKVVENLVNKRLINYLNKINFLSKSQYGFRQNLSTEDAVTALTSHIVANVDSGQKCIAVFLDLKKAFDTVSVPILVRRLENIGIRGVALSLFADYLNERKQQVKIGQYISNESSVTYGVPQGSVLGPTLFLIYINSLCNMKINSGRVFSYADDTAIVFVGSTWDSVRHSAEAGLAEIGNWLKANLLTLNTEKTNYIAFTNYSSSQPDTNFKIQIHHCYDHSKTCSCIAISKVTDTKYLGVVVDQRLSWHAQIELMMGRTRKLMWIFKKLRYIADKKLLKQVYIALAQSLLVYCIPVWGGASKIKFLELERAQRALLKVMYFKSYRFPTDSLYKISDTLSVRQLYMLNIILKAHRALPYDPSKLSRRRKHSVAPTARIKTVYAKRQFMARSAHLYNKINKILNIYPMNYYTCKTKLTALLKTWSYDKTEIFLENNTMK